MTWRRPPIADRKKRNQLSRVIGRPLLPALGVTELSLYCAKQVFNLFANPTFDLLGFVQQTAPMRVLIQCPAIAWPLSALPVNSRSWLNDFLLGNRHRQTPQFLHFTEIHGIARHP